jgi:hypothetical protein
MEIAFRKVPDFLQKTGMLPVEMASFPFELQPSEFKVAIRSA